MVETHQDKGEAALQPFLQEGEKLICNFIKPIYQSGPPFVSLFETMATLKEHYTDIRVVFRAFDKEGNPLEDQDSIVGKPKQPSQ